MWARAEFDRWETEVSTTQSKSQQVEDDVSKMDPTDGENNLKKEEKSLTEAEKLKLKMMQQDQTTSKSDSDLQNKTPQAS